VDDFFHVNLGNVLTIVAFFVGGLAFVYTLRGDVRMQAGRLESLEREVVKMRDVLVQIARQEERLTAMDQRMLLQGQRLDDLNKRLFDTERRA